MSVKVVDLNEEDKEVEPTPAIEEAIEQEQEQPKIINEIVEETNVPIETPKEIQKEMKPKSKAKPKASDLVNCPNCDRQMTYKNLRYSHNCSTEPKPVKPQSRPKQKAKPKPIPPAIQEEEETPHKIPPWKINNQRFNNQWHN